MDSAMDLNDMTTGKVVTEQSGVNCSRHENDAEVGKRLNHVTQQHQQKISLAYTQQQHRITLQSAAQ